MLPLMQEALRDAVIQRRQRRSAFAVAVLAIGVLVGWGLLDMGIDVAPMRETVLVDAAPASDFDWKPFDPEASYRSLVEEGLVVTATSKGVLPANWTVERTLVLDLPTISNDELLAFFAEEGVEAAILCDSSGCELRHGLPRKSAEETPVG
jgi:hypothetical protein